jgi:hypothetical protein
MVFGRGVEDVTAYKDPMEELISGGCHLLGRPPKRWISWESSALRCSELTPGLPGAMELGGPETDQLRQDLSTWTFHH